MGFGRRLNWDCGDFFQFFHELGTIFLFWGFREGNDERGEGIDVRRRRGSGDAPT
jgi:hypothetical protein